MLEGFGAGCGSEGRRHFESRRRVVAPPSVKSGISRSLTWSRMAYLRSFGSNPRRTNIPPIPAGPEFRYLPISSYHDDMRRPTCMYTRQQSQPPIRPACILHCPIHEPNLDQSMLRSRETFWRAERYRTTEQCNTGQEASIRLRSFR
jgi:hypothetical protein